MVTLDLMSLQWKMLKGNFFTTFNDKSKFFDGIMNCYSAKSFSRKNLKINKVINKFEGDCKGNASLFRYSISILYSNLKRKIRFRFPKLHIHTYLLKRTLPASAFVKRVSYKWGSLTDHNWVIPSVLLGLYLSK